MTNPIDKMTEYAAGAIADHQRAVDEFEKRVEESRTSVTAKNRAVVATVDGRGDLTDLKFPTRAYRAMAPAELSALLVETVAAARDQARAEMNQLVQSVLPTGLAVNFLNEMVDVNDIIDGAMHAADEMSRRTGGGRHE
ncbi:YbaB/EbfC family nucleoid-associated protein [Micromonospora lupini]|uniref:YbaB/EbfC family nucleoid-associated protein n=1 Tax=Micromonospora lupini TaxID=285679 RepID=UPI0033C9094D